MKICIDSRERLKIPLFKRYVEKKCKLITEVEVVTAATSDAYTEDLVVGIERKGGDYLSSLFNGQLDKQLHELCNNFEYPFLFIEYDGIKDMIAKNPGTNPGVIVGSIVSVLVRHKVTVCFVGDLYISFVCKLCEKFYDGKNKAKEVSYSPIRQKRRKLSKRKATTMEIKHDVVSRIPGVGPNKGNRLLEHFDNSIGKIVEADIEEIMKIKGIGKVLGNEIKEILK